MNLKEAFRYQKFLTNLMNTAAASVSNKEHSLKETQVHMRKAANPTAEDITEVVDNGEFFKNDDVIRFMEHLVEERCKLTEAIGWAKRGIGFDIDAAVDTNRFRQVLHNSIRTSMSWKAGKVKRTGSAYNFDATGVQQRYMYDIESTLEENYDKENAKRVMREMTAAADEVSAKIDAAMVNTSVGYNPEFDVNDSFNDAMEWFIQSGIE